MMKITICLFAVVGIVAVQGTGYGRREQQSYGKKEMKGFGGYGKEEMKGFGGYGREEMKGFGGYGSEEKKETRGYGKQSRKSYDDESADIDFKLKYGVYLPEDEHKASAKWMVEQDKQNVHYTLDQTHPYEAKSNVYFSMENDH